jgi:RHS repeat-associated protein
LLSQQIWESIGLAKTTERASRRNVKFDRFGNLYGKNASNPTGGQENPLPYTPIETSDIDKNTNRFTLSSGTTYNDAGQVTSDNKFRAMSFGYDANGRMVKAAKANVPDALSVYDALGNRVATKFNDLWQFVIYDAFGKLVAEYGGMNSTDEGGVKYVLSDWQGSVRASVSNSGYVKSRTDYQAFGEEIQTGVGLRTSAKGFGGGISTRQGYGLTEKDDSTGLNHTWFRKNENRAGRWTSPDPYNGSMSLGNPQSFNRYSYVENQPTNFIDPSGLNMEADQACSYSGRRNSDGDLIYDGYFRNGHCVSSAGTSVWIPIYFWTSNNGGFQFPVFGSDNGGGSAGGSFNRNQDASDGKPPKDNKRDEFVKDCIGKRIGERVRAANDARQLELDTNMLWSMSPTFMGPVKFLDDFIPEETRRNKNTGAVAAGVGIIFVGKAAAGVLYQGAVEGTKGYMDFQKTMSGVREVTQDDRDICNSRANQKGL